MAGFSNGITSANSQGSKCSFEATSGSETLAGEHCIQVGLPSVLRKKKISAEETLVAHIIARPDRILATQVKPVTPLVPLNTSQMKDLFKFIVAVKNKRQPGCSNRLKHLICGQKRVRSSS